MRQFLNDAVVDIASIKFEHIPGIEGYYIAQRPEVKAALEIEAAVRHEEEYQRILARVTSRK